MHLVDLGPPSCGAPVRVTTDAQGRYSLPPETTFPTMILGESPLMETVVTVCSGGALAVVLVGSESAPVLVDLVIGAPLSQQAHPFRTEPPEALAFARTRCPR